MPLRLDYSNAVHVLVSWDVTDLYRSWIPDYSCAMLPLVCTCFPAVTNVDCGSVDTITTLSAIDAHL